MSNHTWIGPAVAVAVALGTAATARADVPSPPPSSCPTGARPRAVAHYPSWCEATTCHADTDCASGESCGAVRGLCVRDRDVVGVGWASGHTQRLHEAVSACAAQTECPAETRCELVKRCEPSLISAVASAERGRVVSSSSGALALYASAVVGLVVLAGVAAIVAVVLVVRRRRPRPPPT